MTIKTLLIFHFCVALTLPLLFWSLWRPTHLKLIVNPQAYQVFSEDKLLIDYPREQNATNSAHIFLTADLDRDNQFLPPFLNRQYLQVQSLIKDTPSEYLTPKFLNETAILTKLFNPQTPFADKLQNNKLGATISFTTNHSYQYYETDFLLLDADEFLLEADNISLWGRPNWHHELILFSRQQTLASNTIGSNYLNIIKIIISKITLSLLCSAILLDILVIAAKLLTFFPRLGKTSLPQFTIRINWAKQTKKKLTVLLLISIATLSFILTLYISSQVFHFFPHSQDEVAYLYQAKIFSLGQIFTPSLPDEARRFFDHEFILNNDKRFSLYTPGNSLLLAVGNLFGIPFIINPLLAALSLVLVFHLVKKLFSFTSAIIATCLTLLSPFFLMMSASYFSHSASLLSGLLFFYCLLEKRFFLAGLALGFIFLTRPYNTLIYSLIPLCFLFDSLLKNHFQITKYKFLIPMILSFGMMVGLEAMYNLMLTGNLALLPYNAYSPYIKIGFGQRGVEWPAEFTPLQGLTNTGWNLYSLLDVLSGWPYVLTLVWIPFALTGKSAGKAFTLLLFFLLGVFAHFIYFAEGTFYGPRLWYDFSLALLILTAVGIVNVGKILTVLTNQNIALTLVSTLLLLLIGYSAARNYFVLPGYQNYNSIDKPTPPQVSSPSIVFISSAYSWQPYGRYFILQFPDLTRNQIIYARDKALYNVPPQKEPLDNCLLKKYFPQRNFYLMDDKGSLINLSCNK